MNRTLFPIVFTLLIILTQLPTVFAQEAIPPWHIATLEGHTDEVTSLKFSPDYATLASGSADGTVRLWEADTGKHIATLKGHAWSITSLAFSADSRTLASAAHTEVWVWDVASGRREAAFDKHTDKVTAVALSTNATVLASSSLDKTVRVWDLTTGTSKAPLEHSSQVESVALSPNGKTVASAVGYSVYLWDVASGQVKIEIRTARIYSLAFSPNGRTLASGEGDHNGYGRVNLWDVASGEHKADFQHSGFRTGNVTSVVFSADGRTIISGGRDKTVALWDVTSKERKATFEGHAGSVRSAAISPNSSTVASGSEDWTLRLWDAAINQERAKLEGHTDWVNTVAFNPSGGTLVSGSSDGTVRVWNATTGNPQATLEAHAGSVEHVVFSPDGTILASLSADEIKLWSTTTWQRTATFREPANNLTSVAFCLDGRALAIGNKENVRVWDFAKGIIKMTIPRSSTSLAFGDGSRTLAIGHSSTVHLWNLAPPKWELSSSGAGVVGTTPSTDNAVVSITGQKPDLVVDSVRIESASDPGKLYLYATLRNQGTAQSTATTLQYYRSTDDTISPSDTVMLKGKRDALPPNGTFTRRFQFPAPTSPGTYYYGACVDSIPNESNTDNNCSAAVSYTVGAQGTGLTLPEDFISEVAYGADSTYFVLTAQFPTLMGVKDADVVYGKCTIKLDLPGVPDKPVSISDKTNSRLDNPGYFMVPLATPRQRIGDEANELAVELVVEGLGLIPVAGDAIGILYEGTKAALNVGEILKATADPQISLTSQFIASMEIIDVLGPPSIFDTILQNTIGHLIVPPAVKETAKQIVQAAAGRPNEDLRFLFLLNGRVPEINIEIEQPYFLVSEFDSDPVPAYTATYAGTLKLKNSALAAPSVQPMSLTNYPAFQSLPPEAQAYLLQHFRELMNTRGNWQIPEVTSLLPNYPNPFNPETWIPYQLAEPGDVKLTIYDIQGRLVRSLDLGHQRAGMYHSRSRAAHWDGRNAQGEPVASGVYFYTLTVGDFTTTRKMLIRK